MSSSTPSSRAAQRPVDRRAGPRARAPPGRRRSRGRAGSAAASYAVARARRAPGAARRPRRREPGPGGWPRRPCRAPAGPATRAPVRRSGSSAATSPRVRRPRRRPRPWRLRAAARRPARATAAGPVRSSRSRRCGRRPRPRTARRCRRRPARRSPRGPRPATRCGPRSSTSPATRPGRRCGTPRAAHRCSGRCAPRRDRAGRSPRPPAPSASGAPRSGPGWPATGSRPVRAVRRCEWSVPSGRRTRRGSWVPPRRRPSPPARRPSGSCGAHLLDSGGGERQIVVCANWSGPFCLQRTNVMWSFTSQDMDYRTGIGDHRVMASTTVSVPSPGPRAACAPRRPCGGSPKRRSPPCELADVPRRLPPAALRRRAARPDPRRPAGDHGVRHPGHQAGPRLGRPRPRAVRAGRCRRRRRPALAHLLADPRPAPRRLHQPDREGDPRGVVSQHLVHRARAGQMLQLEQAEGEFVLPSRCRASCCWSPPAPASRRSSGCCATCSHARTPVGSTSSLVHVNADRADPIFRDELRALAAAGHSG